MSDNHKEIVEFETPEHPEIPFFVSPPMTTERYAQLQGLSVETVKNQVRQGTLPSVKQGKRRLINTYAIACKCLTA
ncbi:MAG: helix-turn-helix domain-containing protein [Cellvibrionaceae bacterium]